MKRFKFKFETIETLRKMKEDTALAEFGKAQRALQEERRRKEQLQQQLQSSLERREVLASDRGVEISAFHIEQSFITGLKQKVIQQDQAIYRAGKSVEKAYRTFLHARRQVRVMEMLRSKHLEEYKKERTKRLEKDFDDLMIMRHRLNEDDKEIA